MKFCRLFFLFFFAVISVNSYASESPVEAPSEYQEINYGPISVIEDTDMLSVTINGGSVQNLDELHVNLAKALHFPEYYGKNFDALKDLLSDDKIITKKTTLTISAGGILGMTLGESTLETLLDVLNSSQEANSNLMVWYWQ